MTVVDVAVPEQEVDVTPYSTVAIASAQLAVGGLATMTVTAAPAPPPTPLKISFLLPSESVELQRTIRFEGVQARIIDLGALQPRRD